MLNGDAFYKLLSWLSPSYPVGAFSYSHGLEAAVDAGLVFDASSTRAWLEDIVRHGAGACDVTFLARSYDAAAINDWQGVRDIEAYAKAFQPSAEFLLEQQAQGRAFLDITLKAWPTDGPTDGQTDGLRDFAAACRDVAAYPIVLGVAASAHSIPCPLTCHAYLHGFVANLVSAALRLVPLGQTDGQLITAQLKDVIATTAVTAAERDLNEISNMTLLLDIMSMQHETQYTRLFRS